MNEVLIFLLTTLKARRPNAKCNYISQNRPLLCCILKKCSVVIESEFRLLARSCFSRVILNLMGMTQQLSNRIILVISFSFKYWLCYKHYPLSIVRNWVNLSSTQMRYKILLFLVLMGASCEATPDPFPSFIYFDCSSGSLCYNPTDFITVNYDFYTFILYDFEDDSSLYIDFVDTFLSIVCDFMRNLEFLANMNQTIWLLSYRYRPTFEHKAGGVDVRFCEVKIRCKLKSSSILQRILLYIVCIMVYTVAYGKCT